MGTRNEHRFILSYFKKLSTLFRKREVRRSRTLMEMRFSAMVAP